MRESGLASRDNSYSLRLAPIYHCSEDCSRPGSCFVSDVNKLSNTAGTIAFAANVRYDVHQHYSFPNLHLAVMLS